MGPVEQRTVWTPVSPHQVKLVSGNKIKSLR